ncbi:hypothetical protein ACFL4X_02465 [Gemmatimonadota bacterium]
MTIPSGISKVILPLAMLFIFGVSWFGLYKPEFEKISEYKKKPAANKLQIEQLGKQLSQYNPPTPEERQEWARLEEEINRRLPKGKRTTEFYALLSKLAVSQNCQNFRRQELAGTDSTYATGDIPRSGFDIQIDFECGYKSLKGYLDGLKHSERLIEIVGLEVNRSLPLISVTMVLRSYYLP